MAQSGFLSRLFNRPKGELVKLYEPTPRFGHCAVSLGGQVYSFAGHTADFGNDKRSLSTHMEVFDPIVETWVQRETVGDPPGGLCAGAIAASHSHLYHYGGYDGSSYHGDLSKFCPATLLWTRVSRHSADGPMKKSGCCMICCGDILGLFGGYSDDGFTDEFHLFDIAKELWSSPTTTGTRPTPRAFFSFTEIDDHRGILFAGRQPGRVRTNDTYLMDLQLKEWTKLVDGGRVPVEREGHAACCINVGDDHPLLLVTGGVDKDNRVLKDAWLLDIVARRWKELTVPEGFQPRCNHSLTATSLAPGITVATAFRGKRDLWGHDLMAETTLLQFERSADKWNLTDVVLNSQRGCEDRVRDKRMKIEAAVARQQRRMTPAQPQATSLSDESHTVRETQALQASQERERVLEQRAQEAERREHETEQRVQRAELVQHEAEVRAQEAEKRCHNAEERVRDTVLKHHTTEAELVEMDQKYRDANLQANKVKQQLDEAERKQCEADQRADEAERKQCEADQRADEAERKQCEADQRADEAERKQCERADKAERRGEELASRARDAEVKLLEVEEGLREVEQRLHATEQRCHEASGREHAVTKRIKEAQIGLHQAEQFARKTETEKKEAQQYAREIESRLSELQDQFSNVERESVERIRVLEAGLGGAQRRAYEAEATTQNALQATDNANRRVEEITQSLRESEARAVEHQTACQTAEDRVRELEGELEGLQTRMEEFQERAQQLETQWVVQQGEIQLTEEEKGRGGWAVVRVANFRGLRVAAKCPYGEIISDYNREMLVREMNMAARLRHPNLIQFIGATIEGEMVVLTELMSTTLRDLLRQGRLPEHHITSISLDVARALNYLHLMRPDPIVHRDISSANVLLEPGPNNSWKAKVSDYGSVNLQRQLRTVGPGSPVYAAPEANYPDQQSPKMDIFSFGVLLIEMCTARFPEVAARQRLIRSIQYPHFVELIGRCTSQEIGSRPSASEIITELSQPP